MDDKLFNELLESAQEAALIAAGKLKPAQPFQGPIDVAQIRSKFNLSQPKFAALLQVSVNTLRKWEQHQRSPTGPSRRLLQIAQTHPLALLDTSELPTNGLQQ